MLKCFVFNPPSNTYTSCGNAKVLTAARFVSHCSSDDFVLQSCNSPCNPEGLDTLTHLRVVYRDKNKTQQGKKKTKKNMEVQSKCLTCVCPLVQRYGAPTCIRRE